MSEAHLRPATARNAQSAPFLRWPVSQREYYRVVAMALLLTLTWGGLIYGVRVLIVLTSSLSLATGMHLLLRRGLRWGRAQALVYPHTCMSVLLVVALMRPTWPAWPVLLAAMLMPLIFSLVGGPGKERVPVALAAVLLIQYVVLPACAGYTYTGKPDAILARDRVLMGDIRDQHALVPGRSSGATWPTSLSLAGNDAMPVALPSAVAGDAFNEISAVLLAHHGEPVRRLSPEDVSDIEQILQRTLTFDLPWIDLFMLGVTPSRVGTASLIAITIAGLLLAYRYILRFKSMLLFLGAFVLASALFAFTPHTVVQLGLPAVWEILRRFPMECLYLLEFLILNSDAPFAAVYLLAIPGTEPLSPRGRNVYLVLVGMLAAGMHRLDPAAPAATLLFCLFAPLAPLFDRLFAARSWVNR
jgi:Na+-transporting NADH:ubiquinone oxidoreductase subunit NqrB